MSRPLTARQQHVFDFIVKTMGEFGYPPTRAEIAKHLASAPPTRLKSTYARWSEKGLFALSATHHVAYGCPTRNLRIFWIAQSPRYLLPILRPPLLACPSSGRWPLAVRF